MVRFAYFHVVVMETGNIQGAGRSLTRRSANKVKTVQHVSMHQGRNQQHSIASEVLGLTIWILSPEVCLTASVLRSVFMCLKQKFKVPSSRQCFCPQKRQHPSILLSVTLSVIFSNSTYLNFLKFLFSSLLNCQYNNTLPTKNSSVIICVCTLQNIDYPKNQRDNL